MPRTTVILLAMLLLSPALLANDKHKWANVERLKPGTFVLVEYWNDSRLRGQIDSSDDSGLVLVERYPTPYPGFPRTIDRRLIRRVRRIPNEQSLPNPQRYMFVGGVLGVVAGAVDGGARTGKGAGAEAEGVAGGLAGIAVGAAGCAIVTFVKASLAMRPGPALIYEDVGPRPVSALGR